MSRDENASAGGAPTPQELKQALKAFRKRLRLTQLDEESKLGGGPLSHNRARIVAITPPNQFAAGRVGGIGQTGQAQEGRRRHV